MEPTSTAPDRLKALPGIWQSTYRYPSSSRQGVYEGRHLVQMHHAGKYLIAESLADSKSYVLVRLTVQGNIATGSWQEQTDPHGYYKGAIYHGAIQLVISEDGSAMRGKWVGFGKAMTVNVGSWEFEYVGQEPPA